MHVNTYKAPPSGSQGKVYWYLYALACTNNTLMETKQDTISNKQHILEQKDHSPNKQEICQRNKTFFRMSKPFCLTNKTTSGTNNTFFQVLTGQFLAELFLRKSWVEAPPSSHTARKYACACVCMYVCMCMKMYIRRVFRAPVHFYFHLHKIMVFTFKHSWFLHTILTQVYT